MSRPPFKYFVVFAEMRTGSNFLEQSINQFDDLKCYGELFNPHFVSGPNRESVHGVTFADRERDPFQLISAIQENNENTLPGFRYFNNHDHRILGPILDDPECAKVILTRNPLDSYVSRKIAGKTGQWKLTDLKDKRSAKIEFQEKEFLDHLEAVQTFQVTLLNALQTSGQTAFYINYDDINSVDVLNGLARFLGSKDSANKLKANLKRQNPATIKSKVKNFDDMSLALSRIDFLNLSRTPNFEPRRGAGVPGYVAGTELPVLFLPIKAGPEQTVLRWMEAHNRGPLAKDFNQKTLRQWRRAHEGYQCLAAVGHPVKRAYSAFCEYVFSTKHQDYSEVRAKLKKNYGLSLPDKGAIKKGYSAEDHKAVFLDFLTFLKGNLLEQTRIRIDPAWASQTAVLAGISEIAPPHHIVHEANLPKSLAHIEDLLGLSPVEFDQTQNTGEPFSLSDIYDDTIEEKVRDIYGKDYLYFGFKNWA